MTTGLSLVERFQQAGAVELLDATARAHGITRAELLAPCRRAPFVAARRQLYTLLRARGWSYPRIAWAVDKDHQTIMHALGAVSLRYVRRPPVPRCAPLPRSVFAEVRA